MAAARTLIEGSVKHARAAAATGSVVSSSSMRAAGASFWIASSFVRLRMAGALQARRGSMRSVIARGVSVLRGPPNARGWRRSLWSVSVCASHTAPTAPRRDGGAASATAAATNHSNKMPVMARSDRMEGVEERMDFERYCGRPDFNIPHGQSGSNSDNRVKNAIFMGFLSPLHSS